MRVGVIPHVLPLLLSYDATAEEEEEAHAAAALAVGATDGTAAEERGPKFLGLGIVRSNMQVRMPQSAPSILAVLPHGIPLCVIMDTAPARARLCQSARFNALLALVSVSIVLLHAYIMWQRAPRVAGSVWRCLIDTSTRC